MSEFSCNTAAKILKNPYRLQTVTFKLFLKGKKTKMRKKKEVKVAYLVALVMATEGRCSHTCKAINTSASQWYYKRLRTLVDIPGVLTEFRG